MPWSYGNTGHPNGWPFHALISFDRLANSKGFILMRTLILFMVLVFTLSSSPIRAEQDKAMPEGVIAIRGNGMVTQQMFDARMAKRYMRRACANSNHAKDS